MTGIVYLLRVRNVSAYKSSSVLPADEVIRAFDMHGYGPITSAAAMPSGCLVVGRSDGSVGCFQLGMFDPSSPGTSGLRCFVFPVWPLVGDYHLVFPLAEWLKDFYVDCITLLLMLFLFV